LEVVVVHADHEVLMDVDDNSALAVGNPHGILNQQAGNCPIHLLKYYNNNINLLLNYIF
jgi:hypothetical protein